MTLGNRRRVRRGPTQRSWPSCGVEPGATLSWVLRKLYIISNPKQVLHDVGFHARWMGGRAKVYTILGPTQTVVHYLGSHSSCTLSRVSGKLYTIPGYTQLGWGFVPRFALPRVPRKPDGGTYRTLQNVAGSGATRELGQSRDIEIISFLQFGNGRSTEGSTYPCIGNSRMWLARAPDGSQANPDT